MESEAARTVLALVRGGSLEQLDEFLEKDPSAIRGRDHHGNGVLHVACHSNNKRAFKFGLRRGLDINARNTAGQTPLHYCFAFGHAGLARYLVAKGADDAIKNRAGLTPYEGLRLHGAASGTEERVGYFKGGS